MHIVCHMAASVDGRLHPSRWSPFVEDCSVGGVYEEVANQYDYVGWMIGRVTMAEYSEAITESEPAKLRPAEAAPAQGIKLTRRAARFRLRSTSRASFTMVSPCRKRASKSWRW